jgi:hypothetical protein
VTITTLGSVCMNICDLYTFLKPKKLFTVVCRLVKFFESGVMGAALKVSGADRSAWIVDGGSNGGVMKLAGQARLRLGSAGSRIPLIGVGVAQGEIDSQNHTIKKKNPDIYDSEGHSHLILCVDPDGNCPTKLDQETEKIKPAFGYEIEYTKLFEDSLSRVFNVPIVGLLGAPPLVVITCRRSTH